jgi:hypothetical protein
MVQMKKRGFWFLSILLLCSLVPVGVTAVKKPTKVAQLGDIFPPHSFPPPTSSEDRDYLGLTEAKPFTIGDIKADLVVVELLNVYCTSCQKQAPIYSEVFTMVEKDSSTKDRVKWMGVGIGNNEREVAFFRKARGVSFPIVTDLRFDLYEAVGGKGGIRTPFTLLVRKDEKGRGIIVDSHMGFRRDKEEIIEEIKAALQYDLAYLKIEEGKRAVLPATERLKPPLSDDQLLKKIGEGMAGPGGAAEEIRRLSPEEEYLYAARVKTQEGEQQFFAKVVSWPPVCDICHDIHFIYIFDGAGKITNFIPIHLTKYGNREWTQSDIDTMKSRLIGRSLLEPFEFNRDVDAITRATITSVVIFHRLNKGKDLYTTLMRQGLVKQGDPPYTIRPAL